MADEVDNLRAELERTKLLYEVSKVIHSSLDPQEALQLIVKEAVNAMGATSGSVALINPTTGCLEINAAHGLPAAAAEVLLQQHEGITGWVVRYGKPVRVGNVAEDPRYIAVSPSVKSELAVPLVVAGELRGTLNLDSDRTDAFSAEDQSMLEELGVQAAGVIHNTWMYEQLRMKARLFEALLKIGQAINSTLNLDDTLQVVTRESVQLMDARMSSLMLLDQSGEFLELRASHGAGEAYLARESVRVNESLIGTVIRRRKPVQDENVQNSGRYQANLMAQDEGLVSLLSVPLVFGDNAIGVLNVYTSVQHVFPDEEVRILATLANLSAVAIEKARLYERIVDVEEQLRMSEQLSAIGLLAAEVAHEIRNPLTVMKMLYHSLDLNFEAEDPRSQDAKIMGEKIEHLGKIVDQILDFARRSEPELEKVDINQLVEDLGLLTRHKLKAQSIRLERVLDPDIPEIMADATQLEQAFLNLTLNAAQAMSGGGLFRITTIADKDGVQVRFQDDGPGMDERTQREAFSSWFTADKQDGTGLGLAIVARVIEAHGGKISIQSAKGDGTTFTLDLPSRPPERG